jgi:hydroxypyruvate reductase
MMIQPEQFSTNSLRRSQRGNDICEVLAAAINSADGEEVIKNKVSRDADRLILAKTSYDLNEYKRVFVIGAGKAAVPMAKAIFEVLGKRITAGIVITKDGYLGKNNTLPERPLTVIEASHPIPEQRNVDTSSQVVSLIRDLKSDDLVICLLSGGGSSLMMKPSPGVSLKDLQITTALLLNSGATIHEINTIRKHLDELKGGGLAKLLFPAAVVSLILSDVVGDSLDMIASGPTVADPTTFKDAWAILNKYQILDRIPSGIQSHIINGMGGNISETLKPGDPILDKVQNVLVWNNSQTALTAIQAAKSVGFNSILLTTSLHGEASQVGVTISESAKSILFPPVSIKRPTCLIAGGETTVTIKGTGKGGRNQELALGAVQILSGTDQIVLVSLATDGGDGPTDAAGAVVTNQTYSLGLAKNLNPVDYLDRNDSYNYFEPLGDLIKTGPTLTNVNDLVFIFAV